MSCPNFDNAVGNIARLGTGPLSVSGDAGSVTQRPAQDLIAIANYLAGICASKTRRLGVRYTKLVPGGTVDVHWRGGRWDKGYEI